MPLIDWFRTVGEAANAEAAYGLVMSNPALLWEIHWPEIEAWIGQQPAAKQQYLRGQLQALRNLAEGLSGQPSQWPKDTGPIHALARKVSGGEWTLPHALALAAGPEVSGNLTPLYVQVVAERARVQSVNGDWPDAVTIFRLLLAALDALPDGGPGTPEMRRHGVVNWIETAGAACMAVPDGRLFRDALRRAEAYLPTEADPAAAADAMHRLGVLHLDPWISGRSSQNYGNDIRIWRQRLADTYGPAVAADPAAVMPEPVEALTAAVGWFQRALPHRTGEERGRTLKALAEALVWREIAGGEADRAAVRAYANEALGLLPPARNEAAIQVLRTLLRFAEDAPEPEAGGKQAPPQIDAAPDLLWLEPADVMRSLGDAEGRQRYLWLADAVMTSDPHRAVALMLRLWPSLIGPGDEMVKRSARRILGNALAEASSAEAVLREANGDLSRLRPLLAEKAKAEGWTPGRQVAALAGIALALTTDAHEDEGLKLLRRAVEVAPQATPALADPLRVLEADLVVGTAVNAYEARQWDQAIERYVEAVPRYTRLGLPETALEVLARAEDVTFRDKDRSPQILAVGLAAYAGELTAAGAPRVADRLHRSWLRVLARMNAKQPVNVMLLWLVLQTAKGAAFATMLQGADYDWRRDPEATALLSRIAELRGAAGPQPPQEDDPVDNDLMLVAYAGEAGGDAAQDDPLANLERRFDAHVAKRLVGGKATLEAVLLGNDLHAAIGGRTVLMSHFAGPTEDGRLGLTTVLQTSDDLAAAIGAGTMPSGVAVLTGRRRAAEMSLWGPTVAALRRAVTDEPGPAEVVPEAAARLASDYQRLLGGGLAEHLAKFRAAGRDHLCIHSHGPYHFYPLHLLGPEGSTLADDWIVTAVPHPSLLRRRMRTEAAPEATARAPVAALGLDFSDGQPHGLTPLPGAAAEARAVAAIFGGPCWVNADATEARLLEALTGAERVHIATHGQHDVSAPLFQRLFLHPDSASDGIFHAFEALGTDLRHLDLVTLSACETALGRCDISDTLRGLPAALFIAGVSTIIATLWPVDDRPARQFFETLYAAIAKGTGKLDAFREAQIAVRRDWPAYRDWGAFQYAGLW